MGSAVALGLDGFSLPMVLLATLLALLASRGFRDGVRGYYALMLILEAATLGVFMVQDWSIFYVFWELVLIPLFFLINRWGGRNRQGAALNFVLYTLGGSIFLLIALLVAELARLGLPEGRWPAYLERLALELPGWSGLWLWRHRHPGYRGWDQPVAMLDYLAVRLILERLGAQDLCATTWGLAPGLEVLKDYLSRHPAEFLVRCSLYYGPLPEYLASRAQRLV